MKRANARTGQLRPAAGQGKQKNTRVPEWTRDAGKIVVVPVEFTPAAHALLSALAVQQKCGSVAEYILRTVKHEVRAVAAALADKEDSTLEEFFGTHEKEVA